MTARRRRPAPIRSISNALRILETFLKLDGNVGVNAVARFLRLSPSVAHRVMMTLCLHDFLEQDAATRKYRIGPKALEVGLLYLHRHDVATRAIRAVQDALPEYTCFYGVLADDEVLILATSEGSGPIRIGAQAGERRYARATAIGKALLALLPDSEVRQLVSRAGVPRVTPATITNGGRLLRELRTIRQQGYAVNDEESIRGVLSVGVAIRDAFERPIAGPAPPARVKPGRRRCHALDAVRR